MLQNKMQADVVSKDIKHSSLLNSTVIYTFICNVGSKRLPSLQKMGEMQYRKSLEVIKQKK